MFSHKLFYFLLSFSCLGFLSSCHMAQAPEDTDDCIWDLSVRHPVIINLSADKSFEFFQEIRIFDDNEETLGRSADNSLSTRYTVKAYVAGSDKLIAQAVSFTPQVELNLPVGKIDIIAWADYVNHNSYYDKYFFTDEFNEILVLSKFPYVANDPYKLGCWGKLSMVMAYNTPAVDIDLSNVMGQLRVIATDAPRTDVTNIRISYPGRIPSAINAFTGNVNYSWADVEYATVAEQNDDGMMLLGFDNILADDEPVMVPVRVEMRTADGKVVARRLKVEAPIKRGGITEIRAPFYSILEELPPPDNPGGDDTGDGGVGIKPDIDDEVIIVIK